MKIILPAVAAFLAILSPPLAARPLKSATVSRVVNEVETAARPGRLHRAAERDILEEGSSLHTGPRSRAELTFSDGTLARLGAETFLEVPSGARELSFGRGTLLLQVPRFRGSACIRAGALALACGGATVLVEHLPGKSLKAVVLEGEMRVSVARFFGDSIVVPAGKMLIAEPAADHLPEPVDTDLRTLVSSSTLIVAGLEKAEGFAPLPSLARIVRQIARQEKALKSKRLIRTNLVIFGSGTKVVVANPKAALPPAQIREDGKIRVAEIAARESGERDASR